MKFSTEFLTKTTKNFISGVQGLIGLLAIFLIALIVWFGVGIYDKINESENTITVTASSEVYAKPDLGLITLSVVTEAKTVGEAMAENTEKMNDVIAFVEEEGVEGKDIKTTNFNISPRYDWCDGTSSIYPCPPGNRILIGYEVTQSLQVKIRDLDKTGAIIQGATDQGANQVSSLQFTIENEDSLKEEARGQAIEEAKAKAETLASQLNIRLVRIISFSDSNYTPYYYDYGMESAKTTAAGGSSPQIETGENKITATVSITYKIK